MVNQNRVDAERIAGQSNGFGVPCAELLKIPEARRAAVWVEIVKIGAETDARRCDCNW